MKKAWNNGKEKAVKLTDEDAAVFAIYLELIYRECFPEEPLYPEETDIDRLDRIYLTLTSVYVLAEMLGDVVTKNLVLDSILVRARELQLDRSHAYHLPHVEAIQVIYARTPVGSLARKLLVDLHNEQEGAFSFLGNSDDVPLEFRKELARRKGIRTNTRELFAYPLLRDAYYEKPGRTRDDGQEIEGQDTDVDEEEVPEDLESRIQMQLRSQARKEEETEP